MKLDQLVLVGTAMWARMAASTTIVFKIALLCKRDSNTFAKGESLHCALVLDYVPPEEPPGKPLGYALRIR